MDYIALVYFVGMVVAINVHRYRAGLGLIGRIAMTGPGGVGILPTLLNITKAMFWPVTLAYWLATGRPEPTYTYEKLR